MEPTKEVKVRLLEQEIGIYESSLYVLEVRYRVAKKINADKQNLEEIQKEIEQHTMALDELKIVLKETLDA